MTRVTLMQALVASIAAALLVAATPFIARGFARVTSRWVARIVLAPAAAIAVALWAASETHWAMGKHLVIPVAVIAAFGGFAALRIYRSIVAPLVRPGQGSWIDRLKGNAMRVSDSQGFAALAWMGQRVRWTLAVVVVAIFGAYWYGDYDSRSARRFLVSSTAPTCVAVRQTPEGIICAMTDLTRRRVLPQIRMLSPTDPKQKLTVANLSPLSSPLDADRKLFRPRRTAGTTGTVYSQREAAPVQAGRPRATTPAKKPTTKRTTAKKPTAKAKTTAKSTTKKKTTTSTTRR
jgi:hypothetical protein